MTMFETVKAFLFRQIELSTSVSLSFRDLNNRSEVIKINVIVLT